MEKFILCLVLLIAICVNTFALAHLHSRDKSPRYELEFEVINPKFVPANFSSDSYKELKSYRYKIPESLLPELSTEELALYTVDYPVYGFSTQYFKKRKDFNDFNGFVELTKRDHWVEELTALVDKNYSEGKLSPAVTLERFLSSYYVYTRMNVTQQKNVLRAIKNMLDDMMVNVPNGENLGRDYSIFYHAGWMVQSYYPDIARGIVSSDGDISFYYPYEEAKEKIVTALQNAIERGGLVEVENEN